MTVRFWFPQRPEPHSHRQQDRAVIANETWQSEDIVLSVHPLEPVDPDVDLHLPLDRDELVHHHGSVLSAIAAGGVLGALARQLVGEALPTGPGAFPWGTFLINVSGCLLVGILMEVLGQLPAHHRLLRPFLGVGILGGFSTFSTYAVQSHELVRSGHPLVAIVYLTGTVLAAFLAVVGGVLLVRRLAKVARRYSDGVAR